MVIVDYILLVAFLISVGIGYFRGFFREALSLVTWALAIWLGWRFSSVLDPVLTGTIRTFLDPAVPFASPSLIVCADPTKPDAVADPALAEHFASISPATEFVVIEGAGHLIHDELSSRDRFRDVALGFVDRVAATAD